MLILSVPNPLHEMADKIIDEVTVDIFVAAEGVRVFLSNLL